MEASSILPLHCTSLIRKFSHLPFGFRFTVHLREIFQTHRFEMFHEGIDRGSSPGGY
uniref:Uncharacterized protein n=1 Tax=Manihot esculenta TaxID=3983 RepID=A0A2C9VB70_MANES